MKARHSRIPHFTLQDEHSMSRMFNPAPRNLKSADVADESLSHLEITHQLVLILAEQKNASLKIHVGRKIAFGGVWFQKSSGEAVYGFVPIW